MRTALRSSQVALGFGGSEAATLAGLANKHKERHHIVNGKTGSEHSRENVKNLQQHSKASSPPVISIEILLVIHDSM